jgi:tetratricopeptide (TPR) repeat protein
MRGSARRVVYGVLWAAFGLALLVPERASAQPGAGFPADPATTPSKDWKRVRSTNFVAEGNASEKDLRGGLLRLESFRAALGRLHPGLRVDSAVPTRIVVFKDADAFNRFKPRDAKGRPRQDVAGYFSSGPDASYIVFGPHGGAINYTTIFHEYTHYVVDRNMGTVPLWLNEGLAEFYSTFLLQNDGRAVIGRPPAADLTWLRRNGLGSLREIVRVDNAWRSDVGVDRFYAQSWAFVHYLLVGRETGTPTPIDAYMDAARRTSSADEAFTLAFGVDTEGMIGELRGYLRLPSFKEIVMPMPADVGTASDVVPMTEPEARLLGADLLLLNGATEEAEKELAPLAALAQGNAAVSVAIGRVRLAQDRRNEAVAALSHSAELSPSSFAAQYYLANALAALSRHEEALNAFDRAIAINPAAPAPWVGLSISALALGRDAQSNAAFKRAMQLDANREWYRRRAYQALAFGRNEVALADARSYIDQVGWSGESGQYMAIAAVIAARRCGDSATADSLLANLGGALDEKAWTSQVVGFLSGRTDAAQFLSHAKGAGQQTEAHTYIGFQSATEGRLDDALTHLRWVAEQGARNYLAYRMAKAEIDRIARIPR